MQKLSLLKVLTENYFLIYRSYKISIYNGTDDFQHYFEIPLICGNINEAICQIRQFWSFVFILCSLLNEMCAVNLFLWVPVASAARGALSP